MGWPKSPGCPNMATHVLLAPNWESTQDLCDKNTILVPKLASCVSLRQYARHNSPQFSHLSGGFCRFSSPLSPFLDDSYTLCVVFHTHTRTTKQISIAIKVSNSSRTTHSSALICVVLNTHARKYIEYYYYNQ